MITAAQLRECMPYASHERITAFVEPLNDAMAEFGITTYVRQAMFLAQAAHESGSLRYTREIADGSAYEGRADLGNTQPGDGRRFRGRGLFQVTGRANYLACGNALGLDLIAQPELLELPGGACRSAGWFWQSRNFSGFADARKFGTLTRMLNGGYNGLDDRIEHYLRASRVLGIA
jgi:putative chitinase